MLKLASAFDARALRPRLDGSFVRAARLSCSDSSDVKTN